MASVSQALDSLLPSQPHPAKLTSLANALLAQSRLKAPNLKSEEEIARPYACAEIACNKLRIQLRLPASVKARPPCKPAVYKKLITFLEGVLTAQKRDAGELASSTPKRRVVDRGLNGTISTATSSVSSSKRMDAFVGKVATGSREQTTEEAPDWAMPLIRKFCQAFSTPSMPTHVYTGFCVVLKLAGMWPLEENNQAAVIDFKTNASTLLIALYLLVLTRMQIGDMTTKAYTWRCAKAVEIAELGGTEQSKEMVQSWIKRLDTEGWCEGQEWFSNVPEGVVEVPHASGARIKAGEDAALVDSRIRRGRSLPSVENARDDLDGILLPGLGTMMQDAVMWLGEDRKSEFEVWKDSTLSKIKMIEKPESRRAAVR